MRLGEFELKMTELLFTEELEPYTTKDVLHNGLQSRGREEIKKVGFGVSASISLFKKAVKEGVDAIVVHHGINVEPLNLDRLSYERLAFLIKNDISMWASHFLLDAHPELGHPAQIIKLLDGTVVEPYLIKDAPWGAIAELPDGTTMESILKTLQAHLSEQTVTYEYGPKEIQRMVCATGMGSPYPSEVEWLLDHDIDLFLTGEAHEWIREIFREAELNFIAGGHYHTEQFGVQAVQQVVQDSWGLETVWLDLENPV